jgi:two-component system chemotaxis response regulator CheY
MSLNILLVDDSATVRAVLSKTLQIAGVPVKELYQAANGQEALAILSSHWIDLVLADINMPVMTGIELVVKMSADNLMKSIPVIIVSTDGSATRIEELRAKGVRAFVRKPFTPELIYKVVTETVGV